MCLVALHQSLYMTSSAISVICLLAEQQNLHTCSMFVFKMLSLMLATVQNSDFADSVINVNICKWPDQLSWPNLSYVVSYFLCVCV